jgi:hypothetical protein
MLCAISLLGLAASGNVFTLQPDGILHLDVTITSPQLPSAVSYTLNYKRK